MPTYACRRLRYKTTDKWYTSRGWLIKFLLIAVRFSVFLLRLTFPLPAVFWRQLLPPIPPLITWNSHLLFQFQRYFIPLYLILLLKKHMQTRLIDRFMKHLIDIQIQTCYNCLPFCASPKAHYWDEHCEYNFIQSNLHLQKITVNYYQR